VESAGTSTITDVMEVEVMSVVSAGTVRVLALVPAGIDSDLLSVTVAVAAAALVEGGGGKRRVRSTGPAVPVLREEEEEGWVDAGGGGGYRTCRAGLAELVSTVAADGNADRGDGGMCRALPVVGGGGYFSDRECGALVLEGGT